MSFDKDFILIIFILLFDIETVIIESEVVN